MSSRAGSIDLKKNPTILCYKFVKRKQSCFFHKVLFTETSDWNEFMSSWVYEFISSWVHKFMILEIPYDVSYCDPSLQNKFRSRLSSLGDVLSFSTNICLDELEKSEVL